MKRYFLLFAFCLLISACATTDLNRLIGQKINVAVDEMGDPSAYFTAPNGNKVFVWEQRQSAAKPFIYSNPIPDGTHVLGDNTGTYWCKKYLEVDAANLIIQWRSEGNNCF
jgi:hypothetical protein